MLKSLAQVLTQRLRKTDVIGRYGGEEFAAILVNTSGADAKKVMDAIRESFSRLHHRSQDKEFVVTFSVGIAEYPRHGEEVELNEVADRALYEAKHGGRNRAVLAEEKAD